MRPLTEDVSWTWPPFLPQPSVYSQRIWLTPGCHRLPQETRAVFEKLHKFLGKNIRFLVDRKDEPHVLRLQKNRVLYVRESIMRRSTNVSLEDLGVCQAHFSAESGCCKSSCTAFPARITAHSVLAPAQAPKAKR